MKNNNKSADAAPQAKRSRRKGLKGDFEKLQEIIEVLTKSRLTKKELAEKIGVEKGLLTDGALLEAVKLAGNAKFLENLDRQPPGRSEQLPYYNEKKGILISQQLLKGHNIANGQKYTLQVGRKKIITLRPLDVTDEI